MSVRTLFVMLMFTLMVVSACTPTEDNRNTDVQSPPAPGNTNPNEAGGGVDTEGGIVSTPEPGGGVPAGVTEEPAVSWTATAAAGGEVMTDTESTTDTEPTAP